MDPPTNLQVLRLLVRAALRAYVENILAPLDPLARHRDPRIAAVNRSQPVRTAAMIPETREW